MFTFKLASVEGLTNLQLPIRKTSKSAAYDLLSREKIYLKPFEPVWVGTGLIIDECLDDSYYLRIAGRSSFFMKKIYTHPGTIDADFPDEIKVGLMLMDNHEWEDPIFLIEPGDSIAQIFCEQRYPLVHAITKTEVRVGGFGSTGQ